MARLVSLAASTATFVVIARAVSAGSFGRIALGLAVVGIGTLVFSLQSQVQLARSSDPALFTRLAPVALSAAVVGTLLVAGGALTLSSWLGSELSLITVALAPMILAETVGQLARGRLAAVGADVRLGAAQAAAPVGRVCAVVGAALVWGDAFAMASAMTVGTFLGAGATIVLAVRFTPIRSGRGSGSTGRVIRAAAPLAAIALNWLLISRADIVVLGALRPEPVVGAYAAAQRLLDIILTFQASAMSLVLPATAMLARSNLPRVYRLARQIPSMLLLPAVSLFAVWGDVIVERLFGEDLVASHSLYLLFGLALVAHIATGPAGAVWIARGGERSVAVISLVSTVLNIGLSVALGMWMGAEGVALATLVTLVILNSGYLIGLRPLRGTPSDGYWWRVLALLCVTAVLMSGVRVWLGVGLAGLLTSAGFVTVVSMFAVWVGRSHRPD